MRQLVVPAKLHRGRDSRAILLKMKLLLVEDDTVIADGLIVVLKSQGLVVDWSTSIAAAKQALDTGSFAALIVDRNLPDGDGLTLISYLRRSDDATPIILLTAEQQSSEKVKGLNLGADDYLGKPFDTDELIARIKALLRRRLKPIQSPTVTIGQLQITPDSQAVTWRGQPLALSPKEYLLLEYLCLHQGQAIDRVTLLEQVWGESADLFSNTVDVHISYLRRKLANQSPKASTKDKTDTNSLIKTVKGKGYLICQPST